MPDLDDFLESLFEASFAWGLRDCLLCPADWVWLVCGRDPAANWRGQYTDSERASNLLAEAGGMLAVIDRGMTSAGLERTRIAERGDVGVLLARTRQDGLAELRGWTGGICLGGGMWTSLTRKGLILGRPGVVAAWSVGYRG